MKIGTSDHLVSNQSINYTPEKSGTKFSDIFKAASNASKAQGDSATISATANTMKQKTGSNNVITDMELYESLKSDSTNNNYQIAKALIENNAVNVENIDPKNCTELELNILNISYRRSKGQEQMDVRRGFHLEITISIIQYIRQYRNGGVTPAEQNEDWINIMNNHSKEQIALGNSRDKYDKINEYFKDLVSYADGLKNQAVLQ